jgi:hypothetical protein
MSRLQKNKIKLFCQNYQEYKKLKKDDDKEILFRLNIETGYSDVCIGFAQMGENLINLDDEDLEYLYNKYSKQLEKEMKDEITRIKEEYGRVQKKQ